MLGDLIGEEQGKITGLRVLEAGGNAKVEVTIKTNVKILGLDGNNLGSYFSAVQPGGFVYGEEQGIITTMDGSMATWTGSGTGRFKPGGGVSYRGSVYFRTTAGKLAHLAGMALVYEHESDAADNVTTK